MVGGKSFWPVQPVQLGLALLACLLAALLQIAASPAALAQTEGAAEEVGKFKAVLSPRLIMPPEVPHLPGVRATFTPGEVIMRAPLGWLFHGRLAQRVNTQVMGVPVVVEPDETLRRAMRFEGGDLARFGEGAKVYCQAEKSDMAKSFFSALTLGLSESANRFEKETQFCMLDSDADNVFDHAFLIGTKRAEDMVALAIEPVSYSEFTAIDGVSRDHFMRDEGDYIEVVYNRTAGLFGRGINATAYIGGKPSGATYMRAQIPGVGAFPDTPVTQAVPRKLPRSMRFANAEIEIIRHNSRAGEVEIEYKRDFGLAVLTLVYHTTIYY